MTQKKPMSNIFNSFKNCCWLGSVTPSTFFIQSFLRAFISEVVAPKLSLLAAFPFSRSKKLLNTVSFIFFLTLYNTIPFNLIYEGLDFLKKSCTGALGQKDTKSAQNEVCKIFKF